MEPEPARLSPVTPPAAAVDVRPRRGEWAALALFPPVVWFAVYVSLFAAFVPDETDKHAIASMLRLATLLAVPLSLVVVARAMWGLGQGAYWTIDGQGLHHGLWRRRTYRYEELEALFVGLPVADSWLTAPLARLGPIALLAEPTRACRASALAVRASGGHLLVVGLTGPQFEGGPAFRDALFMTLSPRLQPSSAVTPEERRALRRHLRRSCVLRT